MKLAIDFDEGIPMLQHTDIQKNSSVGSLFFTVAAELVDDPHMRTLNLAQITNTQQNFYATGD